MFVVTSASNINIVWVNSWNLEIMQQKAARWGKKYVK